MSEQKNSVADEVSAALEGVPVGPAEDWKWTGPTAPNGKPMIELPRDGRSLSIFADEVGQVLARNGVFVRDGVPVVVDPLSARLEELDADCLRTYAEKTLLASKFKKEKGEEDGRLVVSTMSREQARGVLRSHHFRQHQRVVAGACQVPIPVMRPGGIIEMLQPGWDPQTGMLVMKEGR
jgi:hypothetical protein